MRFADPMPASAKAGSPDGVPPSPQVRTATAATPNTCRVNAMAPDPGDWRCRKEAPDPNFGLFAEFVNSEVEVGDLIALTARAGARISPRNFRGNARLPDVSFRMNPFPSTSRTRIEHDGPSLRADRQSGA